MSLDILFLLKQNSVDYLDKEIVIPTPKGTRSSGLLNSATFVKDALVKLGVTAEIDLAVDGNSIDSLVTWYKPSLVILEAIWVTPDKLAELSKLHPNIRWVVRLHSETPFLAMEGVAFGWIKRFVKIPRVKIASNSPRCTKELSDLLKTKVLYLPNYYPMDSVMCKVPALYQDKPSLNIGCFGAVRPFKNQVLQAMAAIAYGDKVGKQVIFHVNGSRVETGGEPILKSLRALFQDSGHVLTEHKWYDHEQFLGAIAGMDLVMQVSFTETFNIVTADAISKGIPIVTSKEIYWSHQGCQADPTSLQEIQDKLDQALGMPRLNVWMNRTGIIKCNATAIKAWVDNLHLKLDHVTPSKK